MTQTDCEGGVSLGQADFVNCQFISGGNFHRLIFPITFKLANPVLTPLYSLVLLLPLGLPFSLRRRVSFWRRREYSGCSKTTVGWVGGGGAVRAALSDLGGGGGNYSEVMVAVDASLVLPAP